MGYTNIYAQILDLARDPRWGRVIEAYSEDPYLTSRLGVATIRGLQDNGVASTPKHYCIYSVPNGGRDGAARTDPHESLRQVEMILMAPLARCVHGAKGPRDDEFLQRLRRDTDHM